MRNAAVYDLVMAPFERLVLGRWRRNVFGAAQGRVLEIGSGTGWTLPHFRQARSVVLTDPSASMLRRSTGRARGRSFSVFQAVADGEALPFSDASFDTAVVSLALCTVPSPARALAEVRRVLKPGGALRLLEHIRVQSERTGRLQDFLTPIWKSVSKGCHLNRRTMETALACGFEPVEVRYGMGGWMVAATMRARREGSLVEPE